MTMSDIKVDDVHYVFVNGTFFGQTHWHLSAYVFRETSHDVRVLGVKPGAAAWLFCMRALGLTVSDAAKEVFAFEPTHLAHLIESFSSDRALASDASEVVFVDVLRPSALRIPQSGCAVSEIEGMLGGRQAEHWVRSCYRQLIVRLARLLREQLLEFRLCPGVLRVSL